MFYKIIGEVRTMMVLEGVNHYVNYLRDGNSLYTIESEGDTVITLRKHYQNGNDEPMAKYINMFKADKHLIVTEEEAEEIKANIVRRVSEIVEELTEVLSEMYESAVVYTLGSLEDDDLSLNITVEHTDFNVTNDNGLSKYFAGFETTLVFNFKYKDGKPNLVWNNEVTGRVSKANWVNVILSASKQNHPHVYESCIYLSSGIARSEESTFCLGSHDIVTDCRRGFIDTNSDNLLEISVPNLMKILATLNSYIRWESLEGGPYHRMEYDYGDIKSSITNHGLINVGSSSSSTTNSYVNSVVSRLNVNGSCDVNYDIDQIPNQNSLKKLFQAFIAALDHPDSNVGYIPEYLLKGKLGGKSFDDFLNQYRK